MRSIALYDFNARNEKELSFKKGQVFYIIDQEDPNWWVALIENQEGNLTPELNNPFPF